MGYRRQHGCKHVCAESKRKRTRKTDNSLAVIVSELAGINVAQYGDETS